MGINMAEDIAVLGIAVESSSVDKAKKSLADLAAQGGKTESAMQGVGTSSKSSSSALDSSANAAKRASSEQASLVSSLKATVAGYLSIRSVIGLSRTLDEYTKFNALIKNATSSQAAFNVVFADTNRIAKESQTAVSAVSTLYSRLINNTRDLGVSQKSIGTVVETVSLALKAQGASVGEAQSAMLQLSQAFGKGRLDGDELRTALEAMPNLMRQLAQSIGVPYGALKDLGEQGELTTEVMLKAFTDQTFLDSVRAQAKETRTLSGAWQVLKDQLTIAIGDFDKASGVSTALAQSLGLLADNANILLPILGGIAAALVAIAAPTIIAGITAVGAALAAISLPVIAAIAAVTALGVAYAAFGTNSAKTLDDLLEREKELESKIRFSQATLANRSKVPYLEKQLAETRKMIEETKTLNAVTESLNLSKSREQFDELTKSYKTADDKAQKYYFTVNSIIQAARQAGISQEELSAKLSLVREEYEKSIKVKEKQTEVQKAYNAVLEARKSADKEIVDLGKINNLLREGYEIDEARLRVQKAREGATQSQINALVRELEIQKQLQENSPAAIRYIKEQIQLEKDMHDQRERYLKNEQRIANENFKNAQDEWKRQNERMQREFERTSEIIERSLTDAIMRGFEKGKSFAENFRDVLKNMFKTLILQPVVKLLVDASGLAKLGGVISGAFGTSAVAGDGGVAGGGFNGLLSQGKNLFQAVTNGFDSLNNSLIGSIGDLGTFLSTGTGGLGDVLGGFIGQYSSQIANVLPFAGAAFSLLTGDIKGAVSQGIGAGIGMAVGGPVGGFIGGALGSVVGGLFGGSGEKYKQVIQEASGTYAGGKFSGQLGISKRSTPELAGGVSGLVEAFTSTLGNFLEQMGVPSNVSASAYTRLRRTSGRTAAMFGAWAGGNQTFLSGEFGGDGDMAAGFKQFATKVMTEGLAMAIQSTRLSGGIKALFAGITDTNAIINMMNATVSLNRAQAGLADRFGLTVDQAARVSKQMGLTGNDLVKFVGDFATLANGFNSIGVALIQARDDLTDAYGAELPESIKAFDAALKSINTSTSAGISKFAELFSIRSQFEVYQAAIDGLKSNVRGALFSMVSEQELFAMQQEDLAKMFGELNMSVPGSVQELIALGKSIDFTTEEGLNLAAVFPSLVQAFNATQSAADDLMNSLKLGPDRFRSLFEYSRAQAYAGNGISLDRLPSYDVGTSYVPKTGPALIHQGERILTAAENRNHGNSDAAGETRLLRQETQNMRRELRAIAISASDSARALERLQKDGFVIRDVDQNGDPQVVKVEVVA